MKAHTMASTYVNFSHSTILIEMILFEIAYIFLDLRQRAAVWIK